MKIGEKCVICLTLSLVGLGAFVSSCGRADTSVTSDSLHTENDCRDDLNRIQIVANKSNLSDMEKLATDLQAKWNKIGGDNYYLIMDSICKGFESTNFRTDDRYDLAEEYALTALQKPDTCPVDPLVTFSLSLRPATLEKSRSTLKVEQWLLLRQSTTRHWLYALYRMEKETDPNFDFSDLPAVNISPPGNTTLSSGADPSSIKDGKERAAYESAIEKNRRKINNYNKQYRLKILHKTYAPIIEDYVVKAYLISPHDLPELQKQLEYYRIADRTRRRILSAVLSASTSQ